MRAGLSPVRTGVAAVNGGLLVHAATVVPARRLVATVDAWQDLAGPDVDLEAEAAAYLIRHGDRPARDPRGAWLGWLTKARDRADAARPAPPKPPCPEPLCADGWLTTDDPDHPRPCPQCRPHLRLAQEAS